jgi:hypothetical protein
VRSVNLASPRYMNAKRGGVAPLLAHWPCTCKWKASSLCSRDRFSCGGSLLCSYESGIEFSCFCFSLLSLLQKEKQTCVFMPLCLSSSIVFLNILLAWMSLRHYATSRKVAGSILDGVIAFFN